MQTIGIAPAFHHSACVFIDDDHFAVSNHVVYFVFEDQVRLQRLIGMGHQFYVFRSVEVFHSQKLFHPLYAFFGEKNVPGLFIDIEVIAKSYVGLLFAGLHFFGLGLRGFFFIPK